MMAKSPAAPAAQHAHAEAEEAASAASGSLKRKAPSTIEDDEDSEEEEDSASDSAEDESDYGATDDSDYEGSSDEDDDGDDNAATMEEDHRRAGPRQICTVKDCTNLTCRRQPNSKKFNITCDYHLFLAFMSNKLSGGKGAFRLAVKFNSPKKWRLFIKNANAHIAKELKNLEYAEAAFAALARA
jgi:hypothetical protein